MIVQNISHANILSKLCRITPLRQIWITTAQKWTSQLNPYLIASCPRRRCIVTPIASLSWQGSDQFFESDNWHLACYLFSWISCQRWCNTCHLLHIICSYSGSGNEQYPEALMHNVSPATAWITYRVNPDIGQVLFVTNMYLIDGNRGGEVHPKFDLDQRSDHCQWSYLCTAKDQLKRQDLDQDQDLRSRSYHVHRHTLGLEIFGVCPLPWSHTLCTHTQETG